MADGHGPTAHVRDSLELLAGAVAAAGRTLLAPVDPSGAGPAVRSLADALEANQAILDGELFPAMCESVAGSDPVCIVAMQRNLSAMHRELMGHLWGIDGQAQGSPRQQELLLSGCAQYLAYQLDEVVPMAERLLEG